LEIAWLAVPVVYITKQFMSRSAPTKKEINGKTLKVIYN